MGANSLLMSAECYDWLLAASKRSNAIADLPDTIVNAVRKAKMDKRHAPLNKLLK